ncbi:MAG: hypothetical protein PHE78_00245 [Candidatus Gastranaerophilales bacterium]|nr:hypothetical protein [Candidatus Gastranaerophilales bacterium]
MEPKTPIKAALNEVCDFLEQLSNDNKTLKLKAYRPSKIEAKLFLDYFSWEDGSAKQNFEAFYSKELQILDEWLGIYCAENKCTIEAALSRIIDGIL